MNSEKSPTTGVIGLGSIGRGVAGALARAGLDLFVCDVRADATAEFADTARVAEAPSELGSSCDVIVVAVVDDEQVLSVLAGNRGALATASPGATVVVLSTISPATIRKLAELAGARGVEVLDCGVTGGPTAANEGSLVSMVGGEETAIERVRPVLEAFSSLVVHMGPLGSGLQAKLARNVVQYGSWLAAYEGQVLAEAAGIDLAKLAEVIRASDKMIGGASTLMFRRSVKPFAADDDRGLVSAMQAAASLAHKDVRAALELAEVLGASLPLAAMIETRADAIFGVGVDVTDPAHPSQRG